MEIDFQDLKPMPALAGRPWIIAGPCSAESAEQMLSVAQTLAAGGVRVLRAGVWKPRTMPGSFEGYGEKALDWLAAAKAATGMLTATEVATREHTEAALDAGVDYLWIGARTSANPFAVQEIADTIAQRDSKPAVLVKNPVNPDIDLWVGALQRIYGAGVRMLAAVHRGFSTYTPSIYRNEPHWNIPFELRRRYPTLPLLCDPSHIAGRRDLVETVSERALAMGFDGLIIECHPEPDKALSDSQQQLTPEQLLAMVSRLTASEADSGVDVELDRLRSAVDAIDHELVELLARRMDISAEIGRYKKSRSLAVLQPRRYSAILESRLKAGAQLGLDEAFLKRMWDVIHEASVARQIEVISLPKNS